MTALSRQQKTSAPLTQDQLDAFARDGFLLVKGLVPEHERADVDRDSLELIERGKAGPFGDDRWVYREDPEFGNRLCTFRINQLLAPDMPQSFRLLLAYPPLLRAVSQLMGGDLFATSVHSLVFKMPKHGVPAPWHQDPVKVFRYPVFNMDVYLDAAHPDNGGLWVIPGSHLAGYHNPKHHPDFIQSWTGGRNADAPGAIAVETEPGDVIFHATTVIHGSFWSRAESLRRTVYYHFDHLADVALAGDRWPQNGFARAHAVKAAAIAERAGLYPGEAPFDYPVLPAEVTT